MKIKGLCFKPVAIWLLFILTLSCFAASCSFKKSDKNVVVYTSVDQVFAEPVLKMFEKESGIKVLPVYDVEANKTSGLVNRLIAEKDLPRADVFWNGEIAQTLVLKEKGILKPYKSKNASDIPDIYRDTENYWTAFGGRARVFIINTSLLKPDEYPNSINDLLNEKYPAKKIGIAKPLFGTTATHCAALYHMWGREKTLDFFNGLIDRGITVLDGNSVVRDQVADGQLLFGLTDTDDAISALEKGKPVTIVFPDQQEENIGTLIIPNTVSMIKGAPNTDNAKKFIDFILDKSTEKYLLESGWCQVSVRPLDAKTSIKIDHVKPMNVTFTDILSQMENVITDLKELFIK